MSEPATVPRLLHFGVFEVDLKTGDLFKQGLKLKLQIQPFRILAMLLERPGEVTYPPAEPEALETVSRSKRLVGVANASPQG